MYTCHGALMEVRAQLEKVISLLLVMRVPEIELRPTGLVASAFYLAIDPFLPDHSFKNNF